MRALNERLHRHAPLSLEVSEPSHGQVTQLRPYHFRWHQELGREAVSIRFRVIANVACVHTQVARLVGESPSLPVSWRLVI